MKWGEEMLIKNGNIHDGMGKTARRDIRINDKGIIEKIRKKLEPLPQEEIFDAKGMDVFPGFIQTISSWGVNGSMIEIRPSSQDNEEKSNPVMPEMDGFYAFNGRAATAQQLGAFGITAVGVAPTDVNLFGGTVAVFEVDGVNPYKMCLKRNAAMMASVSGSVKKTYGAKQLAPMTRMWIFGTFEQQLKKASEYKDPDQAQEEAAKDVTTADAAVEAAKDAKKADAQEAAKPAEAPAAPPAMRDDKLAALKKAVDGEIPLYVVCDSLTAIEHVREIVSAYPKLKLVIVNGFGLKGDEDWLVSQNIPVIVRTAAYPMDEDAMTLDLKAIAELYRNGAEIVLSGSAENMFTAREDLLWNCSEMMKILQDPEKVLPMITSNPAKVLGVEDLTGSIREGLRADLVIWSGNPLQTWDVHIIRTYSAGREIYREGDEMKCM